MLDAFSPNQVSAAVAFHRILAKICKDATACLFLSQCIYWQLDLSLTPADKKDKYQLDGWFFRSREEWENDIYLNRTEQENARRKLKDLGFVEELRAGIPAKLYYRVNFTNLDAMFWAFSKGER
jgi:hypothetical protein